MAGCLKAMMPVTYVSGWMDLFFFRCFGIVGYMFCVSPFCIVPLWNGGHMVTDKLHQVVV